MAPRLVFAKNFKRENSIGIGFSILAMGAIHGEHGEGFLGHISLNIWNFKKSFWHKLHLIRVY